MAPIEAVISGIGGAFPQSEGLEDFVNNLLASKNLASVDDERWKPGLLGTSPHVGKISNVHRFDNNLFKVHRTLARLMDPLARLMLERTLESILDAGLSPKDLDDTYTSVFMTTTISESESRTTSQLHAKKDMGYAIMAGSKTMMSNRISYFLNLKGPSITLDGDWTVALVALQRAARSIETGESDYALIGAANTCLFPELNKLYENFGVVSSDGKSRSLDASASGCFRSEGAVVFLLQRSDTANRIYARIKGIEEICRGSRYTFVGVDTLALSPLMENLYRKKNVDTKNVKLLTSDGMAIPEVERDEMEASAKVLCKSQSGIPVSTPKTVAGHGDAISALVNIVQAIACMERGVIPPVEHFVQPHPGAKSLIDGKLQVVTNPQSLELDDNSVLAVNTLGMTGCIGHSILQPNYKVKTPLVDGDQQYPRLVIVAGRTEEDAIRITNKIIDKPFDPEFIRLTQQAFCNPINAYTCRAMTIIPTDQPGFRPIVACKDVDKKNRPVWFVYSGMGSQWAGMGKGLLSLPIFAETIQRLQPVLESEGIDLTHTLTTEDSSLFENIIYSFISIAAIQIGLTNVMRSLGIEPDGIIGHSTGELGCAYGDGCLSEEETLLAAYARGKASLAVKLVTGTMASIGMGWEEAKAAIPASVDVACHNSADNCTISGPTDAVTDFVEELQKKNIFARAVNVSNIAFHSRYVKPAGAYLQRYLLEVIKTAKKRTPRWIASSINPGDENNPELAYAGPEFFTNNLLSAVRFEEAVTNVPKDAVVIELAPHGLMQPLIRRGLPEGAATLSLTKRGHRDGLRFLLENVGKMYMECIPLKPWVLAPEVTFPVSRGTASLSSLISWDHREQWPLVINARSQVSRPTSIKLYPETTSCITQGNRRCATPSTFLEIVWKAVAESNPLTSCAVIFSNLEFTSAVEMNFEVNSELELQLQRETGMFEMVLASEELDTSVCIMRGSVTIPDRTELAGMISAYPTENKGVVLKAEDVYAELADSDLIYDETLKTLGQVTFSQSETSGQCFWSGRWSLLLDSMFQLTALTEGKGSIFCGKIRKITIAPQEIQALSPALPVRHVLDTSVLAAPGINIEGYRRSEMKTLPSVSVLDLKIRPLQQQQAMDSQAFIESVAQLRIQNSDTSQNFSILVLEEERDKIACSLQQAIRYHVGAQVIVRKVAIHPGVPIAGDLKGAVVIVTDFRSKQVDRVLQEVGCNTNCLSPMVLRCGVRGGHDGFVTITSISSPDCSLALLVARCQSMEDAIHVVQMKPDDAVPVDLQISVREVILVWHGVPCEGILGAIASVRGKPYGPKARIVVIADSDAPEFSSEKDLYRERLDLGLMVNILKDGRWHDIEIAKFSDKATVPSRIQGYETYFFGLNPYNFLDESMPSLGAFDFCGTRDGSRVMGLAHMDRQNIHVAMPDDILRWNVPNSWSEQEAATVPMTYAVAFHMLTVIADVQPGQRVLVMSGSTPVSQACIRVAISKGCHVVTTAGSEQHRKEVIALNPQVSPDRVLRHDKNSLEYYLLRGSAGKGFDVAIMPCNNVSAVVWQCVAHNGRGFVLSKKNALAFRVGMFKFNHSTGLYGAGADALLTTSERDKHAVQAAVQNGIATGVVRPLLAHVFERPEDIDLAALRTPVKQLLRGHASASSAASAASGPRGVGVAFAIAGGRAESLVSLARAASTKGSTVVLAATKDCSSASAMQPRARLTLRQTNFVPFPKSQSDAKQFLSLASRAENLKAIVINVEDAADRALTTLLQGVLPTVNGALRGVRLLVLTECLALGTETVEAWRRRGLPACAVVGACRQVAHLLPDLFTIHDLPSAIVAYSQGSDCRVALGAPAFRTLRSETSVVPRFAGRTFIEITSLAPRMRTRHHRQEPLPLFTVTGPILTAALVQETANSLLSPVLITDASQQTAENLAQEILRLQPRGPWAMVGGAESTAMVLNAASLVEKTVGRCDHREVVHVAILEDGWKDTPLDCGDGSSHAGSLHLIRQFEGQTPRESYLNKDKKRHFVASSHHIATVLNDQLLSPLTKIAAC